MEEGLDIRIGRNEKYIPEGFNQTRFDELKPLILEAIKNWHCTLFQIKRAAGIPLSEDITIIIERLEEKGEIIRLHNGVLTGFFLNQAGKIPTRFWLGGNDKVDANFEKVVKPKISDPVDNEQLKKDWNRLPLKNTPYFNPKNWTADFVREAAALGLRMIETAGKYGIPWTEFKQNLKLNNYREIWDETRRNLSKAVDLREKEQQAAKESPAIPMRVIDKEQLEIKPKKEKKKRLAIDPNKLTSAAQYQQDIHDVAKMFGLTVRELNLLMRRQPDLQEAYNEGRAARNSKQTEKSEINQKEQTMSVTATATEKYNPKARKGIQYSEEMFEKFGTRGLNKKQISIELGVGTTSIDWQLKKTNIADAYTRGLNKFAEEKKSVKPELKKDDENSALTHESQSLPEEVISEVLNAVNFHFKTLEEICDATNLSAGRVIPALQVLLARNLIVKSTESGETVYLIKTAEKPEDISAQQKAEDFANEVISEKFREAIEEIISEEIDPEKFNISKEESQKVDTLLVGNGRLKGIMDRLDEKNQTPLVIGSGNAGLQKYLDYHPRVESSVIPLLPQKLVRLDNAAISITLIDYNPFSASARSRELVEKLVNIVNEFETFSE